MAVPAGSIWIALAVKGKTLVNGILLLANCKQTTVLQSHEAKSQSGAMAPEKSNTRRAPDPTVVGGPDLGPAEAARRRYLEGNGEGHWVAAAFCARFPVRHGR